jgi:thiamine transporter
VIFPLLVLIPVVGPLVATFLNMPQGGSITLTMLPIIIVSYHLGFKWGFTAGAVYGLMNLLMDFVVYHWASIFIDYIFAFGFISICSVFTKALKGNKVHFVLGIILGGFARYLMHGLSGVLLFAEYTPEGTHPFVYSFIIYNGPYMLGSVILCIVVGLLIYPSITKMLQDARHH